jgi:hypothetical protein
MKTLCYGPVDKADALPVDRNITTPVFHREGRYNNTLESPFQAE